MLKNKWKNLSETMKIITSIIASTVTILSLVSTVGIYLIDTNNKINKAVAASSQIEENTKAIKEIREKYTPLFMHDEIQKYAVTQIDLEIDETMARVAKGQYIGTRYASTLKYYYDNFNFLTSKQRSMIEVILRYYEQQELRNKEIK